MLTKIYATKERSPNLGNFFRTIIPRHKLWCRIHIIIMKSFQYVFRLSINFNTIFTSIPFVTYNKQLWYICYIPPRSTCFIAARRLNDEKTIFLEGRDKLVINTVPITVLGYNTPSWSVTKKKKKSRCKETRLGLHISELHPPILQNEKVIHNAATTLKQFTIVVKEWYPSLD